MTRTQLPPDVARLLAAVRSGESHAVDALADRLEELGDWPLVREVLRHARLDLPPVVDASMRLADFLSTFRATRRLSNLLAYDLPVAIQRWQHSDSPDLRQMCADHDYNNLTVGDLMRLGFRVLRGVRGFGRVSVNELRNLLLRVGWDLPAEPAHGRRTNSVSPPE